MSDKIHMSIILPCQNEETSLAQILATIEQVIKGNQLNAEVIVSDSSSDQSPQIAKKYNVKLLKHDLDGYGRAYLEGFKIAQGEYIFMADCDGSYDFKEISAFIKEFENGADFVIGNRFAGKIEKGAMPWAHRHLGNPVLTFLLNLFFKADIKDVHCGMRAIRRNCLAKLNLKTTGMEFASEMVIRSVKQKLKIKQLPIDYYQRKGKSKLKPLADGWRHLRFMLLYSPLFLFFFPGLFLFSLGVVSMFWFAFGPANLFGHQFYYHPMFFSSLLIITGYQIVIFALFAKSYAMTHLGEESAFMQSVYRHVTIEKGGLLGLIFVFIGMIIFSFVFYKWVQNNFGELQEVKSSIMALTMMSLGIQTFFSSFMLSILGIKEQ